MRKVSPSTLWGVVVVVASVAQLVAHARRVYRQMKRRDLKSKIIVLRTAEGE